MEAFAGKGPGGGKNGMGKTTFLKLINDLLTHVETIDIWINNAGVNQPNKPIWELDKNTIDRLIEIDLKGTILCSKLIMNTMIKQGSGQIYNVEGHGSNDATITGLSLYGTSKRAITYFTEALAHESKEKETNEIAVLFAFLILNAILGFNITLNSSF